MDARKPFAELVETELLSARKRYVNINTYHEGYAVILEELDEFWDECKRWPKSHNTAVMLQELVQIAAMAQRMAEDGGLLLDNQNNS